MSTILVTGGNGTLGRAVVAGLLTRYHRVRLLSHHVPSPAPSGVEVYAGDLAEGTGLDEAVAGTDAIIHCASNFREEQHRTDTEGTRALVQAASDHGRPHLVSISIVGIDRSSYAYYQAKYQAEQIIEQAHLRLTGLAHHSISYPGLATLAIVWDRYAHRGAGSCGHALSVD